MHLTVDSYITEILPRAQRKVFFYRKEKQKSLTSPPSSQSVVQSCKEAQVQR